MNIIEEIFDSIYEHLLDKDDKTINYGDNIKIGISKDKKTIMYGKEDIPKDMIEIELDFKLQEINFNNPEFKSIKVIEWDATVQEKEFLDVIKLK